MALGHSLDSLDQEDPKSRSPLRQNNFPQRCIGVFASVFQTVRSVRLGARTGRTTAGSPSFLDSMDGLGQMEVGLDALQGPTGPCGIFLLHLLGWYAQKLQDHDSISLITYDQVNHVP